MAKSIPGRRKVREYIPPHLRDAMTVARLANAREAQLGVSKMRYVIVCNVHEGIDPDLPIRILDTTVAEQNRRLRLLGCEAEGPDYVYVAELLQRLPEDLRKRVLNNGF